MFNTDHFGPCFGSSVCPIQSNLPGGYNSISPFHALPLSYREGDVVRYGDLFKFERQTRFVDRMGPVLRRLGKAMYTALIGKSVPHMG